MCPGDNEVSIGDYAFISAAYGSTVGDPNWLASADLDGDLEVSIGDYVLSGGELAAMVLIDASPDIF